MSKGPFCRALLVFVTALLPSILGAQGGDLWKEGNWAIAAPPAGACGGLPLLQVRGPGSIFDAANASVLGNLEKALPAALARVCPGVREVIVVSGRSRRLIKVAESSAVPSAPSTPAAPAVRDTPPAPLRTVTPPAQLQSSAVVSGSAVPSLTRRSGLRSLSSAHDIEDKCEALLAWLESSKTQAATPAVNYGYRLGPEILTIFRDEPMTAVFGMPYDKTENRWRLEQHEKVIGRCLGIPTPGARPIPFNRGPNRTLLQYAQQLQQYRQVLDQSFLGQPGPYEPTAISRHVQQLRAQIGWADQAMASASTAQAAQAAFDRIAEQRRAVNGQLSLLSAAERSQVADYLARRQSEMAPAIAEEWFREAGATQKGAASAKVLHSRHAALGPVLSALDAPARTAFEDRYKRFVESLIAEPLQAEIGRLQAVPATLPGVLQIAGWKSGFDAGFRDLRGFPAVDAAEHEFNQNRARVFAGALPAWLQQVEAIPVDGAAITAKRRDMEMLFPSREDRSSPVFVQYETPLKAKEDQLRLRVEAELRKRQQDAAAAAALQSQQVAGNTPKEQSSGGSTGGQKAPISRGGPNAVITATSFSVSGLHNDTALANIFKGDFDNVAFHSDDLNFAEMFGAYLNSYGSHCDRYLRQDTKVEITKQVCTSRWVNGYGVDQGCANWQTVGTGVYADPELYAVKRKLDVQAAMDAPRTTLKILTQKDPFAGAMGMAGNAIAASADMATLVQQNGCASPGLKRFEDNLARFALNKQAIRLGESGPRLSPIDPLPGIPFRDQNYTKLIEDLVRDQATTWVMNRYQSGSVGGVSVTSRDNQGRPSKVAASYTYNGFNGRAQGSLTLTFSEGRPECLYFSDFPATCRTPNRKTVAAYSEGAYQPQ